MVNPEELRFICTRCGNCCTDKDTIVNLTYLDILRLQTGLKIDLKETLEIIGFYVFNNKLSKGTLEKMVVFPIETEKGLAFTGLLKNDLSECYFYEKKNAKCLIYQIRPMLCRTFPFSFSVSNDIKNKDIGDNEIFYTEKARLYCPGIGSDSPIIKYDYWIKIGIETLKELEKNDHFNDNWNKSVKNGKIIPNVKNYISMIYKASHDKLIV